MRTNSSSGNIGPQDPQATGTLSLLAVLQPHINQFEQLFDKDCVVGPYSLWLYGHRELGSKAGTQDKRQHELPAIPSYYLAAFLSFTNSTNKSFPAIIHSSCAPMVPMHIYCHSIFTFHKVNILSFLRRQRNCESGAFLEVSVPRVVPFA